MAPFHTFGIRLLTDRWSIFTHVQNIQSSGNRKELCLPLDTYWTSEQQTLASSVEAALGWNQMTGNPEEKNKMKNFL